MNLHKVKTMNFKAAKRVLSICGVLTTLTMTAPAMASNIGLVGFYQVDNDKSYSKTLTELDKSAVGQGCAVRREGPIAGVQGNLDSEKANRFFVMECQSSVLQTNASQHIFNGLSSVVKNLSIVEGDLNKFGQSSLIDKGENRSYLIKLSYYNNKNVNKRNKDLAMMGMNGSSRANHYKTEAFIDVTKAQGMTRPDEAVVIYYDSPKEGTSFRINNEDFIEEIGKFNVEHLNGFAYYFGASRL
ncbi:MAG: hypothetical protein ACI9FJ_001848 [Alteromonadaceae bacterium]|jgi:hypothetical protein